MNFVDIVRQKLLTAAGAIFKNEGDTTGGADAQNCRRRKGKGETFLQLRKSLRHVGLNCVELLIFFLALVPILERDEEERVVGVLREAEKAEADDGGAAFDAGSVQDDVFHSLCRFAGTLQ